MITNPERAALAARMGAAIGAQADVGEILGAPRFRFQFSCVGPSDADRASLIRLRRAIDEVEIVQHRPAIDLRRELAAIPLENRWDGAFANLIVTAGLNDVLDKYFKGSAYTATWYLGLISSVSYTARAAGDTMSSHSGWTEAGVANAPTYSQANRPTVHSALGTPSAGSVSTSALAYSITSSGTIKGAFVTTNNTKDGTTGTLYSAGLFSGGDRAVLNGDTVNVTLTLSGTSGSS